MNVVLRDESVPGLRDSARREFTGRPVRFTLRYPGTNAYLLLADAAGRLVTLTEMTAGGGGAWRLTLDLRPGRYRYRYYLSDGHTTAYFSPVDADRAAPLPRMDGMDAVFDVAPPLSRTSRGPSSDGDATRTWPASGYASLIPLRQVFPF